MHYMIIETFKNGDPAPVYGRFSVHGRMAPETVKYVSSWVTTDLKRCYQVMECQDRDQLELWLARWSDLVDFEVVPVRTSAQTQELIGPRL